MTSLILWKPAIRNEYTSGLRQNTNETTSLASAFRAPPIKHYRREIASVTVPCESGARRNATVRDLLETPGRNAIMANLSLDSDTQAALRAAGTPTYVDLLEPGGKSHRPCMLDDAATDALPRSSSTDAVSNNNQIHSAEFNARRRCRSAGMIKKGQYCAQGDSGEALYKPSYAQYLNSRVLTFKQNEYNYIREGLKETTPGENLSLNNIYSTYSVNPYPKLLISADKGNNYLEYTWIDGTVYAVTFSDGYYDSFDLAAAIEAAQLANLTYFTESSTGNIMYAIQFYYDTSGQQMVTVCRDCGSLSSSDYSPPDSATWSFPTTDVVPQLTFGVKFGAVLGLAAGTYPSTSALTSDQYFYGKQATIRPNYKPIYYKPNNPGFAQQGAVDSSDYLLRRKYNEVTTAASSFRSAYGSPTASANAFAYSIYKSSYGGEANKSFPQQTLPVYNARSDTVECRAKSCLRVGR